MRYVNQFIFIFMICIVSLLIVHIFQGVLLLFITWKAVFLWEERDSGHWNCYKDWKASNQTMYQCVCLYWNSCRSTNKIIYFQLNKKPTLAVECYRPKSIIFNWKSQTNIQYTQKYRFPTDHAIVSQQNSHQNIDTFSIDFDQW